MNPLPLEELVKQWEIDARVNDTEPARELLKIPNLHAKYARQLVAHSLAIKAKNISYNALKKVKWEYYNGKLDQAELDRRGWEPFRFVLKGDIGVYLDADTDLTNIKSRIALHEEGVNFCGMVMKEINNRTWQLKTFVDYEKFIQGQ
jgi:hypothetical protein